MKLKNEAKIGLIVVLSLICTYIGVNFLKGTNIFSKENIYYTTFNNLNNVNVATPVKISGYKVGMVTKVKFDFAEGQGAVLVLSLNPDVVLTKGSHIAIAGNPLTGAELVITPPIEKGVVMNNGDTIPSLESSADILQVATQQILPQIVTILPEIANTAKRLNEILANPNLDSALVNINKSTMNLNQFIEKLNISTNKIPNVVNNMDSISKNLKVFSNEIAKIKIDSLVNGINEMSNTAKYISKQIKSKDNTAGLLLSDPALYKRLDSLIISADSLVNDIKAQPRKYINLSIF